MQQNKYENDKRGSWAVLCNIISVRIVFFWSRVRIRDVISDFLIICHRRLVQLKTLHLSKHTVHWVVWDTSILRSPLFTWKKQLHKKINFKCVLKQGRRHATIHWKKNKWKKKKLPLLWILLSCMQWSICKPCRWVLLLRMWYSCTAPSCLPNPDMLPQP